MEKWFKKFTMYDESQFTIASDSTTPLLGLDNVVVTKGKCDCVVCGEEFIPEKKYHNVCDWCAENTC